MTTTQQHSTNIHIALDEYDLPVFRFDKNTLTYLADDAFRDGSNRFSYGRLHTLYLTAKKNLVMEVETQWQGEKDKWVAVPKDEAAAFIALYGNPDDLDRYEFLDLLPEG